MSTPTSTTHSVSSTEVRVRPTVAAEFNQRVGATRIRGRIMGGYEYLYAPGLAKHDGGRPWLKIGLARAGAAVGLNLSELFNEVANLDPSRNLQILAAANSG